MKKIISMLLTVALLASLGTAALAEENVRDIDIMGMRMSYPEELNKLLGVLSIRPYGIVAYDPNVYYMSVCYYAMPHEEYEALLNKPDDEFTEADYDTIMSSLFTFGVVLACEGGLETALTVLGMEELPAGAEATEIGSADNLQYYYIMNHEVDDAEFEESFAKEAAELKNVIFAMLKNADFYTPVDPVEETIGETVSFETSDLEGNPVSSRDLFAGNKVTMINYWGTWCGWCVRELPELAEIQKRLQEKGCGIIGILQDGDEPDKVELARNLVKENGVDYPNVIYSDDMSFLSVVSSFPTSFFVDSEGRILCYPISGAAVDQYEQTVDMLLAGESAGGLTVPVSTANDAGAYRITVADNNGDPVKGVVIQFCDDTSCNIGKTDDNGSVSFNMPEGVVYEIHVLKVPEGFEKNGDEFRTLDVYSDLTIILNKAA